ncbi:MAG: hypothetical protein JXB48_24235 [Candidatus Latescibacteria bacterium]|nr:hypothetical protein [Candidatus Latescibacterota bacterium]
MKKIDTIKMVRNIRDKQYKEISGKSSEEIIDYFSKKAKKITEKEEAEELKTS